MQHRYFPAFIAFAVLLFVSASAFAFPARDSPSQSSEQSETIFPATIDEDSDDFESFEKDYDAFQTSEIALNASPLIPNFDAFSRTLFFLLKTVKGSQWKEDTEYWPKQAYPPLQWQKSKGLYSSQVHLNFHGESVPAAARNLYHFPDDNGFVTMFAVTVLAEILELTHKTDMQKMVNWIIKENQLTAAIEAISTHKDMNFKPDEPVYNFWNMKVVDANSSTPVYRSWPANIAVPLTEGRQGLGFISQGLEALGFKNLSSTVNLVTGFMGTFLKTFSIPADADDTACNQIAGRKLVQVSRKLGILKESSARWTELNNDRAGKLFDNFKKYAYKPFATDNVAASTIDPRTYFWMHDFLKEYSSRSPQVKEGMSFVTTWFQNVNEVFSSSAKGSSKMPFNSNNVDATVIANSITGIVYALWTEPETYLPNFDAEMQQLVFWSGKLLEWILKTDAMSKRPDLILLYYPSVYDFYWFIARLYNLLSRPPVMLMGRMPYALKQVRDMLEVALRVDGTNQLLQRAQTEKSKHVDKKDEYFWDEFLGLADTNFGNPSPKYEDRVFSTSTATLALLDIWTVQPGLLPHETMKSGEASEENTNGETIATDNFPFPRPGAKLVWRKETPEAVKQTVTGALEFLLHSASAYPSSNAFFSGSVKGLETNPFWYPNNIIFDESRKTYDCSLKLGFGSTNIVVAVQGVMSDEEFKQKKEGTCFGRKVPVDFKGLNCDGCVFPYWSAPVLTKATRALALVRGRVMGMI